MKKTFKKLTGLSVAAVMVISLAACGGTKESGGDKTAAAGDTAAALTLRLAHSQAPDHLINKTAENFAKLVSEKSDGAIKIDIYPSETLGTSAEMADACSTGDVDFYIASTGQYTQRYKPFSIIEAFYMFRDTDHLFEFYESDSYETLKAGLAETCNVHILAPVYYGSRQMTTAAKPLNTADDISGMKMRAANEPMPIAAFKALGSTPTPIAYNETYLALQQGVADGQENPPMSILAMKFYEVQDYLNITNHQYQMMNIFMSDSCKNKLTDDQMAILNEAAIEASQTHNQTALADEEKAIEELKQYLEVVDSDTASFAAKVQPMYAEVGSDWIDGMADAIQAIK